MNTHDINAFYSCVILSHMWLASSSVVSQTFRLFIAFVFSLTALCIFLFPPSAHSDDGVSNDGIVAVLTAPIDAAIDATFDAIGYQTDDDDED